MWRQIGFVCCKYGRDTGVVHWGGGGGGGAGVNIFEWLASVRLWWDSWPQSFSQRKIGNPDQAKGCGCPHWSQGRGLLYLEPERTHKQLLNGWDELVSNNPWNRKLTGSTFSYPEDSLSWTRQNVREQMTREGWSVCLRKGIWWWRRLCGVSHKERPKQSSTVPSYLQVGRVGPVYAGQVQRTSPEASPAACQPGGYSLQTHSVAALSFSSQQCPIDVPSISGPPSKNSSRYVCVCFVSVHISLCVYEYIYIYICVYVCVYVCYLYGGIVPLGTHLLAWQPSQSGRSLCP